MAGAPGEDGKSAEVSKRYTSDSERLELIGSAHSREQ